MSSAVQKSRNALTQIILNFTPSWFSVNMGTGIISIVIYSAPHQFKGMEYIAVVFYCLNCGLFTAFVLMTLARYIIFPSVFKRMICHPTQSLFIGTLPMGLATIVNATVLIAVPAFGHWAVILSWTLWWIDVALTLFSCLGVPFMMFNTHQLQIEKMTATWLLPIVPAVVAAASGGLVATVLDPHDALITLVISYCLWGIGVGISILIMALYLYRLTIYKLPAPEVIVSAFLPLGPLGQGSFGIIQMAQAGRKVFPATDFLNEPAAGDVIFIISTMFGLIMWGLGFWWLFHGVTSVLVRLISGKIPFSIGFWGFIFPLGVYTAATIALTKALPSTFFSYLAMVFIVCLVILWFYVAGGTLKRMIDRSMFVAPCLSEMTGRQVPPEVPLNNNAPTVQGV